MVGPEHQKVLGSYSKTHLKLRCFAAFVLGCPERRKGYWANTFSTIQIITVGRTTQLKVWVTGLVLVKFSALGVWVFARHGRGFHWRAWGGVHVCLNLCACQVPSVGWGAQGSITCGTRRVVRSKPPPTGLLPRTTGVRRVITQKKATGRRVLATWHSAHNHSLNKTQCRKVSIVCAQTVMLVQCTEREECV